MKNKHCVWILFFAAVLAVPRPALADLAEGLAALEKKDYERAVYEFTKGSKAGDLESKHHLAVLLEEGTGAPADLVMASNLFRECAEAGHVESQYRLGMLMIRNPPSSVGVIMWQHYRQAMEWLRQAGYARSFEAQMALSDIYQEGKIVDVDKVQAYAWLRRAANTLKPGPSRNEIMAQLIVMSEGMTLEEIEKAKTLSTQNFRDTPR